MGTTQQILKFRGCALALEAVTKTNIPMKTENMPRITTDFDDDPLANELKPTILEFVPGMSELSTNCVQFLSWKLFSKIIKLILLLSKKFNGQARDKQISVPVMSTIVVMLLGTNSGVALQCAGNSETSFQIYCS